MEHLMFSEKDILERVDEYTLYCSYLGYEPLIGSKYISPIRSGTDSKLDTDPSFGIFERKYGKGYHEFMWKDQGKGIHGDIFDLVKIVYKFQTRWRSMQQVLIDAGLIPGIGTETTRIVDICEKKYMGFANIDIESKPFDTKALNYWDRININLPLLNRYRTKQVEKFWLYAEQNYPRRPKGIGFSYHIYDKCQLYFPWEEKKKKFRTDWVESCIPGFLQLEYNSPLLIITKSMKDVMCLRSFGYEAVAPRGENIMLPMESLPYFKARYERVLILFDNDMKHKGDQYEFNKIYVPKLWENDKDTSDFCNNHGKQATAEMLRQIISV